MGKPILRPLGRAIRAAFAEPPKTSTSSETSAPTKLRPCPDCGAEVSLRAPTCPKCGAPLQSKLDERGAWCPNCGNRDSMKEIAGIGCLIPLALILFAIAALAGLFLPALWFLMLPAAVLTGLVWVFLPRRWYCFACENRWRA